MSICLNYPLTLIPQQPLPAPILFQLGPTFSIYLFLIEAQLLYNIVLLSAIHQHKSAKGMYIMGASQVALVLKKPPCHCRRRNRGGFDPWVRKIPWRRAWQPTPVSLPGESHGQRSLKGYSPWSHRVQHD